MQVTLVFTNWRWSSRCQVYLAMFADFTDDPRAVCISPYCHISGKFLRFHNWAVVMQKSALCLGGAGCDAISQVVQKKKKKKKVGVYVHTRVRVERQS